jgi:RNA polymerase sigma-B factor
MRVNKHLAHHGGRLRVVGAAGPVLTMLVVTGAAEDLGAGAAPEPPLDAVDDDSSSPDSSSPDPGGWRHEWQFEVSQLLFERSQLSADDPRRAELRSRAIESCLPHTRRLARRFHGFGESAEDLEQVAALGLVKAVDGYDPRVGVAFGAYAVPTVVGELKRHFRDHGWGVRVPRSLQELVVEINRVRIPLTQQLERDPSIADTAKHIGVSEERIAQATMAARAYRPVSLFYPVGRIDGPSPLDQLGAPDTAIEKVEIRESIAPALGQLSCRDKQIVAMRFYGNMTQAQIAAELGISQMHVSRLLRRIFSRLRGALLVEC